ncbi:MAG: hypothetical protein O6768_08645, partial [Planctomycetota bacterium]|nr:hypothetical protein [Planctomycetota bacterium]
FLSAVPRTRDIALCCGCEPNSAKTLPIRSSNGKSNLGRDLRKRLCRPRDVTAETYTNTNEACSIDAAPRLAV